MTELDIKIEAKKLAAAKLHLLLDDLINDWINQALEGDDLLTNPEKRAMMRAASTLENAIRDLERLSVEDRLELLERRQAAE